MNKYAIGAVLITLGSAIGTMGSVLNNMSYHMLAIWIWCLSNPLLLVWSIGIRKNWWKASLSIDWMIVMYGVFFIGGLYATWRGF